MNPQEELKTTNKLSCFVEIPRKSWALMAIEAAEEEEQERKEEAQRILQAKIQERRELYAKGEYELEEGEILE